MDGPGPEGIKRPRLESFPTKSTSHRMHQQHPEPSLPLPLHSHPGGQALRPPSAYHQPPPPSPYDAPPDSRNPLEHPPPGGYSTHYSGYHASHRDHRPPPLEGQSSFSRHSGQPTPTRSPDEMHHSAHPRPLVTKFDSPPQHYPISQTHEPVDTSHACVTHDPQSNGLYHGMPMASPLHDHAPGAPPHAAASAYGDQPVTHRQHSPYSAGPFTGMPGTSTWANRQMPQQRKNTRATQACETCRQRKAKCDEGKPVCGYCKENTHPCRYKEVQPAKADRAQKEIMDSLKENKDEIASMKAEFHELLKALNNSGSLVANKVKNSDPDVKIKQKFKESEPSTPEMPRRSPIPSSRQTYQPMDLDTTVAPEDGAVEFTSGSIRVIHVTGVHRLLNWPTVRRLLEGHPMVLDQDYVIKHEEKKGLLRLYGRGQGIDKWDGAGSGGSGSPASSTSSDDQKGNSSNSLPSLWGVDLGLPNMPDGKFSTGQNEHPGGLNRDGSLKLDKSTMFRLEQSYLTHLHMLHPFLDKARLRRMIERVQAQANPVETGETDPPRGPTSTGIESTRPLKRKHSNGGSPLDPGMPGIERRSETLLDRRISTAIVLLVMALGKIYEHKEDLPGPIPEVWKEHFNAGNMGSPYSHTPSPGTTVSSPTSNVEQRLALFNSRGPSVDWTSSPHRKNDRNVDVIPGLAYFARAVEILGALKGNDLPHVQANLLAGLYTSQLACTIESWTYIHDACRACHFLIRDPTFSKERDKTRVDLIRFAFWTCLQLESDILAELDLKPSGIKEVDTEAIQYPKGVSEETGDISNLGRPDTYVMVYYSFQLHLRKHMDEWQEILYPPNRYKPTEGFSLRKRNFCDSSLCQWRNAIPSPIQWNDGDPPPEYINAARLRGKYYGAKYIIHRPFLFYAIYYMTPNRITAEVKAIYDQWERDPDQVRLGDPPESASPQEKSTWDIAQILISCRLCVNAAKSSTTIFDGVRKNSRLIVTNIFGTAHAQFGNMLVIAAVLESQLSWLVDKREAIALMDRTIIFLKSLAPISSTLGTDASLLETIRRKIEPRTAFTSSFSSNG